MMFHSRKSARFAKVLAALVTVAALVQAAAHAQSPVLASASSADTGLAEIIVTAQKRAQAIDDVGLTITALGSDALAREGIKTQEDLAKSVPGLTYAETDYGRPVFTLRGVGYYDYSLGGYPTTSVYVDE